MYIYVVYDSKAEAYLPPFFMKSKGEALRAIEEECLNPKSNFNKYAADFTFFEIGQWDELTSQFDIYESKVCIGEALIIRNVAIQNQQAAIDDNAEVVSTV
jgi:hypothetical protein